MSEERYWQIEEWVPPEDSTSGTGYWTRLGHASCPWPVGCGDAESAAKDFLRLNDAGRAVRLVYVTRRVMARSDAASAIEGETPMAFW